jgi:hypothetical protein
MANIRGGPNSRMLALGDAPNTAGHVPAVFAFRGQTFLRAAQKSYLAFPFQP